MTAALAILASVLTVHLPAPDRAELSFSGKSVTADLAAATAKVKTVDGLTVLDFTDETHPDGIVRDFFCDSVHYLIECGPRQVSELTLQPEADLLSLFMRDTQRTFGPVYLPSRLCRLERGESAADFGTVITRAGAAFCDQFMRDSESGFDVMLDDRVLAGDDRAWKELVRIALNEGFGPGHAGNRLRLQGLNETGTSNLDFPQLVDLRSLMVCALVCDICESMPAVYAARPRSRSGLHCGFSFMIGERQSRESVPTALRIHRQLLEDDGYCRAFADLIHESCVRPGGEFSAGSCQRRLDRRLTEAREIALEDGTKYVALADRVERYKIYIVERVRKYVADHCLAKLLSVPAPLTVGADGKALPAYGHYTGRAELRVSAGAGKVYYSVNGCDPLDESGELNPLVKEYAGPIEINGRCRLRARTRSPEGQWSALEMVNLNLE